MRLGTLARALRRRRSRAGDPAPHLPVHQEPAPRTPAPEAADPGAPEAPEAPEAPGAEPVPPEHRDYDALPDARPEDRATIAAVSAYTMTSPERILAACEAVRHVHRHGIAGAVVECGVWRGGSSMAMARTLAELGDTGRDLYLFDTFEGMSEPTDADVSLYGDVAERELAAQDHDSLIWARASAEDVQHNMARVDYPADRVHLVVGKVEDTLPAAAPDRIAILRLDTDWYESTRHELATLVPRVSPGGILIIDDYGHWHGARQAVDEWLETLDRPVFLSRIDYTGRIAVLA